MVILSISRPTGSVSWMQSLGGAHRGRMCMRAYGWVYVRMREFAKKKVISKKNILIFLLVLQVSRSLHPAGQYPERQVAKNVRVLTIDDVPCPCSLLQHASIQQDLYYLHATNLFFTVVFLGPRVCSLVHGRKMHVQDPVFSLPSHCLGSFVVSLIFLPAKTKIYVTGVILALQFNKLLPVNKLFSW
jgi:hypothetical protein